MTAIASVCEAMAIGYWEYDERTDRFWCNAVFNRLLGEPAEPTFRDRDGFLAFVDVTEREHFHQVLHNAGDAVSLHDMHFLSSHAERLWLRMRLRRLAENTGAGTRVAAMLEVISDLDSLRQREELFRTIVTQAGDGIDLVDAESLAIVETNEAAYGMLGYSREEYLKLTLLSLQADMDLDDLRKAVGQTLQSSGASFESERMAQQRALQEREQMLAAIFGQVSFGMELVDVQTLRFVQFNRASHSLLGYTREEFQQLRLPDIQAEPPSEFELSFRREYERLCSTGSVTLEGRHRTGTAA